MFRNLSCVLSWLVLIGCSAPESLAQETADRPGEPAPTAAQRELVKQLGDPSFFTRERATEELVRQGAAAKAALTEALKDQDFEIHARARYILNRVAIDEFDARLAAFIADVDGNRQYGLPGWTQFRALVGDGRKVREMFAQMTRDEGALLSAYENQTRELPELFADRVEWLQSRPTSSNSAPRAAPLPSLATVLLIGCDETAKDHAQGISRMYTLLCKSATMQAIGTQAQTPVLRALLEKWVAGAASSGSHYSMTLALKYNLKETGLKQATMLLEGGTTSSSTLQYAIITLGRFGGEEHVRLLTPLLKNKTVCHRWGNRALKKEGTINVEVRDAALVVLLRLTGKAPEQYGFKLLKENPETLYYVYTFGFVEDEEREAAHAKWAAESKTDRE